MRKWKLGVAMMAIAMGVGMADGMALAQGAPQLTLERVFASPSLDGPAPRAVQLSPDGKYLTLLRNRDDDRERYDLWAMDTANGQWRMLIDSKKLGSGAELSEAEKMQRERARIGGTKGIVSYAWAPDARSILVPLDGDLFRARLTGEVDKLPAAAGPKLNAVLSPAGKFASYLQDQNLVIMDLASGTASRVTPDGAGTVHWGEAEFVAQEEMARSTGYWWSPNDAYVAVERFDEAPVGIVTRAAIGAEGTSIVQQRYPKAGTPNALVELYVLDPAGQKRVKVDIGPDRDIYLARVDWAPDGKTLYVQRQNRAQTQLDLLAVDPASGAARVLFSEKAAAKSWINLSYGLKPLDDGSLIWWSERDGHGHLYRWQSGTFTQLTKGPWEVAPDGISVDQQHGRLYFQGNKDDPLERHLYWVDYRKPGGITRLTERGWWNAASMDASGTRAIVSRSNPNQPRQVYLADADGKRIAWVQENAVGGAEHPYHAYLATHRERSFGTIPGPDGTVLHWEMITPKLEPGKRYPVFFQHYGGPGTGQQVTRGWGGALQQYLVSQGYIWFQIDNRGSYNRGKAFEDQIYRAMGTVEVTDQLVGARFLKEQPFVDAKRIATFGWSYGGYAALQSNVLEPDLFKAVVAVAPVTDLALLRSDSYGWGDYAYVRDLLGEGKHIKEGSPAQNAAAFKAPVLMFHGDIDRNVDVGHAKLMDAKLKDAGRSSELHIYKNRDHYLEDGEIRAELLRTSAAFMENAFAGQ